MSTNTELFAAINQIASERGIEAEEIFRSIEESLGVAYSKDFGQEEANYRGFIDRNSGAMKIFQVKEVVEEVKSPVSEIALEDATYLNNELEPGDSIEIEVQLEEDFGRIAAQTAKQVILQGIRESEREAILSQFDGKVGQVFTGLMQRMQRGSAVFEIGKAVAYMPKEEQVPNEFYRQGERYKLLLKSMGEEGSTLIVTRADEEFLRALFEIEVPEIGTGAIEIKAAAREAGMRSKVAVISNQEGVDAIGSCVGQKGIRIGNIMSDLGEEKIDIVQWDEDKEKFIENALSPAKIISVEMPGSDDEAVIVKVDEDQLSLAIGQAGQNVRLAAKLTECRIDIQGPNGPLTSEKPEDEDSRDNDSEVEEEIVDDKEVEVTQASEEATDVVTAEETEVEKTKSEE